ncbi:YtjB family periplasmic protein [Volucribacter amazonae]|uniref:Hemolysin regulation protein AhpA n=1 Tax=Volucribacter amazonae TaxID=256731 RepID=A0A9X4PCT4_9PAST|nr:AhpA/YtjB family protein [Volucribacter amazonae]MDG6895802.1 hemolysin regulation protein AhpA [Volucribacter amazonae]
MSFTKQKLIKIGLILTIILFCASIMSIIFYGIQQFKLSSQLASVNQVAHLSHLLVRQQANLYAMLLTNPNTTNEQLNEHLEDFAKQIFVLDASLYSANGELLTQTHKKINVLQQIHQENQQNQNSQQIVETIYSPEGVIGFLRVTFNNQYGQTTQHKINQIFHQLYGEFILVFLTGILLAGSFHYFLSHYRRIKRNNLPEPNHSAIKTRRVSPSLTYHRRRRRLK